MHPLTEEAANAAATSSLTVAELLSYAPYLAVVPLGWIGWKLTKVARSTVEAVEQTPGRTAGSLLTFLGVTMGPFLGLTLKDVNLGAAAGAAGGSLFMVVTGILLMTKGKPLPVLPAQAREHLKSAHGWLATPVTADDAAQARALVNKVLKQSD